jgi:hypothetical protein
VVAQIALSLILVIAASLFVRTLANLESTELGFNRDHTLLVTMAAKGSGYKDAALIRFYDDLLDRFRSIPGVSDASLSDFPLVGGSMSAAGVRIPGVPVAGGEAARAALMPVGASFFTTMKIPVLMGREFDRRDSADSVPVGVVNEMFAKKYFAGINPLGPHFGVGTRGGKSDDIEIVGVVKNARHDSLRHDTPPIAFIPYSQNHLFIVNLVTFELRTVGNPLIFANSVRRIVQEKDPRVPIFNITTQSAQIDRTIGQERTFADLCACFALLRPGDLLRGIVRNDGVRGSAENGRNRNPRGARGAAPSRDVDGAARGVRALLNRTGDRAGRGVEHDALCGIVLIRNEAQRPACHFVICRGAGLCGVGGRVCAGVAGFAYRSNSGASS